MSLPVAASVCPFFPLYAPSFPATESFEMTMPSTGWQGVQNRAYKLLAAFRNAASKINDTLYTGGFAPSSGLISLTYLLQV